MMYWPILLLIAVLAICAFRLILTERLEIEAVNSRLPEGQRFAPRRHGRYWKDRHRLRAEYRRLFPDGPLESQRVRWLAAVIVIALALAITGWLSRRP